MAFDSFETVCMGILRCKTCGEEIPSGVVSISRHWNACTGKDFSQAMIKMGREKNGKLTREDVRQLAEKHLPPAINPADQKEGK